MTKNNPTLENVKKRLQEEAGGEEPVVLPKILLKGLVATDIPEDTMVQIGDLKDNCIHLDWSGHIYQDGGIIYGEADYTWTRKSWYNAIGLEQYMDLVRRAVEIRNKSKGDVELTHFDDDGAYIQMTFTIQTNQKDCLKAFNEIKQKCLEVQEVADAATEEASIRISEVASRLSGWGEQPLDKLVNAVENSSTADSKGRSLEELMCRLLESVKGFSVTSRIRTSTEEIDISVINDSDNPILKRESAIMLVECKNWMSKCGKNEFVIFKEKVENRSNRCTVGILVSWKGYKDTITKEMLRGSRETILIVPLTGKDIRSAVRNGNFLQVLIESWQKAINK